MAANIKSTTISLPRSTEEFKSIEKQFLDGWPNRLKSQIQVEEIHKINNSSLQSRYQQFLHLNTKYSQEECIGWHGTSAKCHNGSCMSSACSLCQIVQHGFKKEFARKDTTSYKCWGNATYFADKSFVCQSYNGASQINNTINRRCTIMAKINRGCSVRGEKMIELWNSQSSLANLIAISDYDTVVISRDYYIVPTDYLLLYNNYAAVPTYIVVYSFQANSLQVRIDGSKNEYCSFHHEHHGSIQGCDGHYGGGCLGSRNAYSEECCSIPPDYDNNPRDDPYSDSQQKQSFDYYVKTLSKSSTS